MRFAKVVDGALEFAPKIIERDGRTIITNSPAEYAELGYKPIQLTEAPEAKEGYTLSYYWEDDGECCKQVWVETETGDDPYTVIDILTGGA